MNRPTRAIRPAGLALLLGLAPTYLPSCHRCEFLDTPSDGTYRVLNPDDVEIDIQSVTVESGVMRLTWIDEAGTEQFVAWQISESD